VVCVESPPQPATGKEWAMSARVASVLAAERVDDVFLRSGGVHKWAGWDRSNGPPSRMQQRAVAHAAKPAASHPEPRHCNRPVSCGTHGIFGWASRIDEPQANNKRNERTSELVRSEQDIHAVHAVVWAVCRGGGGGGHRRGGRGGFGGCGGGGGSSGGLWWWWWWWWW
jgi:uncharacterized membrane protein YgcG